MEAVGVSGLGVGYFHRQGRLRHLIFQGRRHILADAGIQKRLPQGRRVRREEGVDEDRHPRLGQPIRRITGDERPRKIRLGGRVLLRPHRILLRHAPQPVKKRLPRDRGIHFNPGKMGQIGFVKERQFFLDIQVAIEVDVAVGWMIIAPMEGNEFFLGQIRDALGISPRLEMIRRIRIERLKDLGFQEILRR